MDNTVIVPADITDIRYGPIVGRHGTIEFEFRSQTFRITEPSDVLLVDAPPELARRWIRENYAFLLAGFN
jgi:hypothetical protein